jgi:hypothetical protein
MTSMQLILENFLMWELTMMLIEVLHYLTA